MSRKSHWENVYATKAVNEVSWFREHLSTSLELIRLAGLPSSVKIIDVGGGASTLVDDLLGMGFQNMTVLDVSAAALENAKQRLGDKSNRVTWIEADVTEAPFPGSHYDLWHDRAVFHFLIDPEKRAAYVAAATHALKTGGYLILATFAANGPAKCSGLPVARYGAEELARQFPAFIALEERSEQHQTPSGALQNFTYVLLQKRDASGKISAARN